MDRELPYIPDASGIFKFDASKKAIVVPVSAIKGLEDAWIKYAKETDTAILPYERCETTIDDWEELCKAVHHAFDYGLYNEDATPGEVGDDIAVALNRFAKKNGLPAHNWNADYDTLYGEQQAD